MVFDMPFNLYKNIGVSSQGISNQLCGGNYIPETEILISDYFRIELELIGEKVL